MRQRRTKKNTPASKLAFSRMLAAEAALADIDKQLAGWWGQERFAAAVVKRAKAGICALNKKRRFVHAALAVARKAVKSTEKGSA